MSTKKFGIVAGIALALSVVVAAPASAACSLATLSECDNAGLMALVVQLLGGQQTTQTTGTTISGIPAGFQFTTNLKQGSTGNDVKYLQILLNSDAATSIGNAGKETTYFGAMTKAAVVKFQNKYASEVLAPYGLTAGTGVFGTSSRAKANALIGAGVGTGTGTGTGTTTPATGAYTVSSAANQPAGSLGENSAYNTVAKVSVSAGATAQTITSVTVQRTGLSIDTNVAGVLVVDNTGKRHGNIVTLANNVATITFANDPITVAAGTTAEIQVQANMGTANPFSGTMGFNVTAMSGTPAGLPLIGSTFTLVDTSGTLGGLTADVVSLSTATVSKDIGATGYEIQKFRFVAGANEDINLKKLTMYQNGTVADADITNIKLVAPDGTVLSTVASATNKYVTFDLTAAPYKIAKGLTKDLTVRIDVVNGSSRTAQFIIQNDYDIVATGLSTGLNVIPTAGAAVDNSFPIGDRTDGQSGYNHMTIASGSLYIAKSSTSPSGTISIGASTVTIATFGFEARGEDIEIQRMQVNVNGSNLAADELAGTVRLVTEDGQTIWSAAPSSSGLVANTAAGTAANIYTLSTYYTIPAGTTKKISVVVDTGSTMDSTDTIYGRISDIYYKKLTSNSYATYSASSYQTGNELSASSGTLTVVKNGSLGNSTKVEGQTDVKIGSYLLQTNSTEGVNVSSIGVKITGADAANTDASFTNMRLKKSDGTILGTAVTSPVIDGSTANTFTVSGQLNIPVNTTVQVDVYIDMSTAASDGGANDTLITKISASGVSGTGATSGATANGPATEQIGQTIMIVEGGTLTVSMETSGAASSQFLTTGLSGVELAKIKLAATVENMKVDRLEIRSIKGNGNIAQVKLLGTGLATDPVAAVTNGTAVFTFASGGEIIVPAYGSKVMTIAADTTNIGTITAGNLGTVGFGTMNAMGAGSGAIVNESTTGTAYTAAADDSSEAIAVGNVIYFTYAAASGTITAPGFYMVTTNGGGGAQGLTDNGLELNGEVTDGGTITKWTAGQIVTMLTPTSVEIDADTDSDNALAVGDVVYFYGDVDGTDNSASTGWHVVTTLSAANSANIYLDGATVAVDAGDGIAKFANAIVANALVGNIMKFEEVEPVIALNSGSKSGNGSANAAEEVAKFDVTATGSRDMTFNSVTVEKGGDNSPYRYVSKLSLWNGSNMLAEVASTTAAGTTDDGAGGATTISSATVTVCSGANNTQANELAAISQDEFDKWAVGDTLTFYDGSAVTATATINSITGTTISACAGGDDPTIVFSTSPAIGQDKTVTIWNNRVHFNAAQGDTGDTALVEQSITAGQTMTLTVKADTTAVKTGVTTGNVRFSASVPGSTGPLTSTVGGLNWDYTPLNTSGTANSRTQADTYPVNGNTLTY